MEVWQLSLLSCSGCICAFTSCCWVLSSTVFCSRHFLSCMERLRVNTKSTGKRKKAVDIFEQILYDKPIWKALKVLVEMHGSRRERRSPAESLLVYVCRSNFPPEQLCWTEILLTRHRRERTLRVLSALQTEAENLGGTADLIRPWYNIRGVFSERKRKTSDCCHASLMHDKAGICFSCVTSERISCET